MVRPYGRGCKGKPSKAYRSDWLKTGGVVIRKGYLVTVQLTRTNAVLRAWSLFGWYDVRQFHIPADVWSCVSDDQKEGWIAMALKKPTASQNRGPAVASPDLDLFESCPVLRGYLVDRVYEDGSPRATATLTLFLNDQGALGGTLKDRDNDRALFGVGMSLEELGESLEEQLASANPPWRADKQQTGSSKRIR